MNLIDLDTRRRRPPSDVSLSERAVIGVVLVHPAALDRRGALGTLRSLPPGDFHDPALRGAWREIIAMDGAGGPLEPKLIASLVADRPAPVLEELLLTCATEHSFDVERVGWHADMIRRRAHQRRTADAAEAIRTACDAGDDTAAETALARLQTMRAPSSAPTDGTFTAPVADFLGDEDEADEPDKFRVAGLMPDGAVVFWSGDPKTSKTFAALAAAIAVASGGMLFGKFQAVQGPAVVVAEEDPAKQIRRRLWWLARGVGVDPRKLPIRISAMAGFQIEDDAMFGKLVAESMGAGIIILDALTRIHGVDENSRSDMQRVTLRLTQLAQKTGATVLVIHHYRKPSEGDGDRRPGHMMRGTGDLYALARAVVGAKKGDDGVLNFKVESNYLPDGEAFAVRMYIDPPLDQPLDPGQKRRAWFEHKGGARAAGDETLETKILNVLAGHADPMTKAELEAEVGGDAKATRAALKRIAGRVPSPIELVDFDHEEGGRTVERKGWKLS